MSESSGRHDIVITGVDEMFESGGGGLDERRQDYWDDYYRRAGRPQRPLPSQFAAFVCGELNTPHRVIELGSGDGRDSLFFASHGHAVTGVDASKSAVERSSQTAQHFGQDVTFHASDVHDPSLSLLFSKTELPTLVYARFFLHAITEDEELAFLRCAQQLTAEGDLLAVEYRTVRDAQQTKVTGTHYRRFVQPFEFERRAAEAGFRVTYAVEGFGYAKYRDDDAYVARCVLVRESRP
jgi:cyclopropane fatty-acyl-phospholipid synthase-like methyltransferase